MNPTSSRPPLDDEQLTRYLLGELSGEDEAELEAALFADDAVWDAARQAEDDLIDAYVRGRLDRDRCVRLEARLEASQRLRQRVAVARDLQTMARSQASPQKNRAMGWATRLRQWLGAQAASPGRLALVGVAAAVLLLVIVWPGGTGRGPSQGPVVAMVVLEPTTRGSSVPDVAIGRAGVVEMTVVLDPEDAFPRYRLRVVGPRGVVWSEDVVSPSAAAVRARVPTTALVPGLHELEIAGLRATGDAVPLGSRSFRAIRAAP